VIGYRIQERVDGKFNLLKRVNDEDVYICSFDALDKAIEGVKRCTNLRNWYYDAEGHEVSDYAEK